MSDDKKLTPAYYGLHDGAGPCGTEMTGADGTTWTCQGECCCVLDDNGKHSGPHVCSIYSQHTF